MATNDMSSGKQKTPAAGAPGAKTAAARPVVVQESVASMDAAKPTPHARIDAPATSQKRGDDAVDAIQWSQKSFELWSENASAFLDFAEQLGKAKTLEEAVTLQTRFASERYESFLRQSKDFMTYAQRLMSVPGVPLSGVRAA